MAFSPDSRLLAVGTVTHTLLFRLPSLAPLAIIGQLKSGGAYVLDARGSGPWPSATGRYELIGHDGGEPPLVCRTGSRIDPLSTCPASLQVPDLLARLLEEP